MASHTNTAGAHLFGRILDGGASQIRQYVHITAAGLGHQ